MTDNLDDIFSPERLRHRWQHPEDAAAQRDEGETAPVEPPTVMVVFARLQSLIQQRFPGKNGDALKVMLTGLQELLHKRFPQTGEAEVSEKDKAALNQAIQEQLNTIEDLVEALEL